MMYPWTRLAAKIKGEETQAATTAPVDPFAAAGAPTAVPGLPPQPPAAAHRVAMASPAIPQHAAAPAEARAAALPRPGAITTTNALASATTAGAVATGSLPNDFDPTRILGMVGDEPILAGEVLTYIIDRSKINAFEVPPNDWVKQRGPLIEHALPQILPQLIENKLIYVTFVRDKDIPADKWEEIRPKIHKHFGDTKQKQLIEKAGVHTPQELDARLRQLGTSLEQHRQIFLEQQIIMQAIEGEIPPPEDVSHDQLVTYYNEHLEEFSFEAEARWERLMVRFDRYKTRQEAYQAIAWMGNQVVYGAALEAVARQHSQGPRAADGEQYEWMRKGNLASTVLDDAIFALPVGKLSSILEDEQGYHIVRVLERREAGRIEFSDAQANIRDKIHAQQRSEKVHAFVDRLRQRVLVTSVLDKDADATR